MVRIHGVEFAGPHGMFTASWCRSMGKSGARPAIWGGWEHDVEHTDEEWLGILAERLDCAKSLARKDEVPQSSLEQGRSLN